MEDFVTKQEGKLYKALQTLISNCVIGSGEDIGRAKKPTIIQLRNASQAIYNYESYKRNFRKKERDQRI